MGAVKNLYSRMINALGATGIDIPLAAVKFYRHEDDVPESVLANEPVNITLTCCQAIKHAALGDAVFLTKDNIGCVAGAISLGLVDKNDETPLKLPRVYTEIMREQSGMHEEFIPPSPRQFTNGTVYACKDSRHMEYALFGSSDSGRFKNIETAEKAISNMTAIQPALMRGVFIYSMDFDEEEILPDIIVLHMRCVELARLIQAYQFITGNQVNAHMNAVRAVDSDLIARPYLFKDLNISTFCVGARLIAKYEADMMGAGMPFDVFEKIVQGMEESRTGYPFHLYPGASH